MDKLDRDRPYGTVFGDPLIGYEQNGKFYRHDGMLYVRPDGTPAPTEPEKPEDVQKKTLSLRNDKLREAWNKRLDNN